MEVESQLDIVVFIFWDVFWFLTETRQINLGFVCLKMFILFCVYLVGAGDH